MPKPVAQPASIAEHQADPSAHPHIVQTIAASGTAVNLDASAYDVFDLTLTGNCTATIINPPGVGDVHTIRAIVRQDATHGRTLTVACKKADGTSGTVKWAGGAPTFTSAAATSHDLATLQTVDGGVTWIGTVAAAIA